MSSCRKIGWILSFFVAYFGPISLGVAITLPELASRVENMSRTEREAFLIKGAKEEKEVMFYGTTPVTQVAVLRKSFNARYPFVELKRFTACVRLFSIGLRVNFAAARISQMS